MEHTTHLIKPDLSKDYPKISYGKGIYLYDTEGKCYVDGCSGAVTANIGHGNITIARAMKEQALKVAFSYRTQFTNQPAEDLAQMVAHLAPGDLNWVFFVNSGSEATETAMKIAIQYWQEKGYPTKNRVISRWMSYHGITMGALSMSGHTARRKPFTQLLQDYPVASPPYCYRCPMGQNYPNCNLLCAAELERSINLIGPENIAGFIFEPVIGASGGAIVPPDGYYDRIVEICRRHNILLIADEVMTGFGRTGPMFAVKNWGIEPDIMAIGKGLSAGYAPIAATVVADHIIETITRGSGNIMSGHTYSANPLSCSVALAVIKYLLDHRIIEKVQTNSRYLQKKLTELGRKHPIIGNIRGLGLMWGLELIGNYITGEPFNDALRVPAMVINQAMENGLLIYNASGGFVGPAGAAFMVTPPLTINKKEINLLADLLDTTLSQIEIKLAEYTSLQRCGS